MHLSIGTSLTEFRQDPRYWPTGGPYSAYAIGDSNVAAYLGQDAILDFITSAYTNDIQVIDMMCMVMLMQWANFFTVIKKTIVDVCGVLALLRPVS